MRKIGPRGIVIITVLLMLVVLLLMGMAFLSRQAHLHGAGGQAQLAVAARALAEAGLEDARAKLEKDCDFPPPLDPQQTHLTYSESLNDMSGQTVGRYIVVIDLSHRQNNEIIAVTSTGETASGNGRRVLYAEIDISGDVSTNPRFFDIVQLEDRGGL